MKQSSRRGVTADGMTRVAAVVAALVESSESAEANAGGPLTDLIAKAAQGMERHAGDARILHFRGAAQRERAGESLRAANGGIVSAAPHKLDVIR